MVGDQDVRVGIRRSHGSRLTQLAVILLCFLIAALSVPTIEEAARAPYLQGVTPTSIIVKWKTQEKTTGKVWLGTAPSDLGRVVEDRSKTRNHEVLLSELLPETTYYYAINPPDGMLGGREADHFFKTAPLPGRSKQTRIWVIGDSGTGNAPAKAVRDAYLSYTGSRQTDVWLMLGDNAYPKGRERDYQSALFDVYPGLLRNTPLWPTIGNHDLGKDIRNYFGEKPYFNIFTLPASGEAGGVASGTEAYYSFDYGNTHFICLDSNWSNRSPESAMLAWLKDDLAANRLEWVIAYWHHPPYSKGSHDSDTEKRMIEMRENALPILEEGGVDLVLSGHSHAYERSYLINGYYGSSGTLRKGMILDSGDGRPDGSGPYIKSGKREEANKGAVYVVAGSAGRTGGGTLNHPAMFTSLRALGSVVLDIDGSRLDAKFIDANRKIVDHFTIVKHDSLGAFMDG